MEPSVAGELTELVKTIGIWATCISIVGGLIYSQRSEGKRTGRFEARFESMGEKIAGQGEAIKEHAAATLRVLERHDDQIAAVRDRVSALEGAQGGCG